MIYFGSRFAYAVPYSDEFMNDVRAHNVVNVSRKGKYLKKNNNTTGTIRYADEGGLMSAT